MSSNNKILLIGATSAIAQAVAKKYAKLGRDLVLVARDSQRLSIVAQDLQVRGAGVDEIVTEITDLSKLTDSIAKVLPDCSVAIVCYGFLGDQQKAEIDSSHAEEILNINFNSAVLILGQLAEVFQNRGSGTIAVISSVAGDRGRKSNYVYGAAKAGLSTFVSGLRNRLSEKGVSVLDIRPGFVDTPMTAHLKKGLLFVSADRVAEDIVSAIEKKKDVLYTPWFWRYIMLIIKLIPEGIFKKLSI